MVLWCSIQENLLLPLGKLSSCSLRLQLAKRRTGIGLGLQRYAGDHRRGVRNAKKYVLVEPQGAPTNQLIDDGA